MNQQHTQIRKLLDRALLGVCVVIRLNMVFVAITVLGLSVSVETSSFLPVLLLTNLHIS